MSRSEMIPSRLFSLTTAVLVGVLLATAVSPALAKDSKFFKRVAFLRNYSYQKRLVTTLQDGRIMFFGGNSGQRCLMQVNRYFQNFSKVEVFDPKTKTVQEIADSPIDLCRKDAQAITLPSNKVLIWGADITHEKNNDELYPSMSECFYRFKEKYKIESCQKTTGLLYDPEKSQYKNLFNLRPVRAGATATLLSDGKVIFVGGKLSSKERVLQRMEGRRPSLPKSITAIKGDTERRTAIQSIDPETDADRNLYRQIQLYDPACDEIQTIGHLPDKMILAGHTATYLDPGRVLIIGGVNENSKTPEVSRRIFLFNIEDASFEQLGELTFARESHTVIPLDDERFLIVGGRRVVNGTTMTTRANELELFDLKNKKSRVVGLFEPDAVGQLTAAKLLSGNVLLIAGYRPGYGEAGFFGPDHAESDVALLNTQTWKIRKTDRLIPGRAECAAITTSDGQIFLFGGTARAFINFNRNSDGGQYSHIEEFDYQTFKKQYERKR